MAINLTTCKINQLRLLRYEPDAELVTDNLMTWQIFARWGIYDDQIHVRYVVGLGRANRQYISESGKNRRETED
jgi:hypothetical protein